MSGTSYGTCVLHIAPESAVGGTLAVVQDGDLITLDVSGRRLELDVPEVEITRRLAARDERTIPYARGYTKLYTEHVTQADRGCDFDFLEGKDSTPEPEIH